MSSPVVCCVCRQRIDAPNDRLERRIEWRTATADHSRVLTRKTGDVCRKCANTEADSLSARRQNEIVVAIHNQKSGAVGYKSGDTVAVISTAPEFAAAIGILMSSLGPLTLVSAKGGGK